LRIFKKTKNKKIRVKINNDQTLILLTFQIMKFSLQYLLIIRIKKLFKIKLFNKKNR